MKEIDYEKSMSLCIGRMKEVFSDAKTERLQDVFVVPEASTTYMMPAEYDIKDHRIHIDNERMNRVKDPDHALMYSLLQAVTTDPVTKNQGVCFNGRMESINRGITHMIANLLIPSLDKEDTLFTSCVLANIVTHMAGALTVFDAYFNCNGEKLYNTLLKKLNNDPIYLDTILTLSEVEAKSLAKRSYPSLLGHIEDSLSQMYFNSNDLSLEEMMNFNNTLFTDPKLAPSSQIERLTSCTDANLFVKKEIEEKMKEGSKRIASHEDQLMAMFSKEPVGIASEGKKR